ncbi:MAG: CdaR family protein [Solirubrobacteraceae bacterium]
MGFDGVRAGVAARLRSREAEDVKAIFERLRSAIPDHLADRDVDYAEGLRKAVAAAFDHCLSAIERDQDGAGSPPFPQATLEQAHRAARNGVPLGTVLRRCNEGERLLREIVAQETRELSIEMHARLLRAPESAFRRLMAAIEAEYEREFQRAEGSVELMHHDTVRRLLAGRLVGENDLAALGYQIHSRSHIAIAARGAGAEAALRRLKVGCGHRALVVLAGEDEAAGWLTDQSNLTSTGLKRLLLQGENPDVSAGVGGLYPGLDGFRRSHEEAREGLRLALADSNAVVHYAEAPLLAAAIADEPLRRWLKDLIAPLDAVHRRTLRAYIAARCNASSAASAMAVDRRTVTRHVIDAEERTERRVETCLAEFYIALCLDEYERAAKWAA